ncbi:MAG: hypothetical protein ABSH20_22880 [Tepidisphaeraceae bacterium]
MIFDEDNEPTPISDVPESPIIKVDRGSLYGSVPGLDEEELADPQELQRMAFQNDWAPILALPTPPRSVFHPDLDEDGNPQGAFGSVDWERIHGPFDKARYKADRLAEALRYSLIGRETALEHVAGSGKYKVLDYLHRGVIREDHIVDENMQSVLRWDARIRRQQDEILSLRKYSWSRRHRQDE